jgi:hypothetical protein
MPSLELYVTEDRPQTSQLRALLEKQDAVILRRNYYEPERHTAVLAGRVRVNAVLTVDVTHPPQPAQAEGEVEDFSGKFAKGVEIWMLADSGPVRVYLDEEEIAGALTLFEAYTRVEKFQPAFVRLDQRSIGLGYRFREGLEIGIQGVLAHDEMPAEGLSALSAIVELEDDREARYVLRLEHRAIADFEDLLRSAGRWLAVNSYQNVLGT